MCGPAGRWLGAACLVCGLLAEGARAGGADDGSRLAEYFGFLPLEVYKLDTRIAGLVARDLDGDKADDIIVSNNARSRIDVLLTSKKGTDDAATPAFLKSEINE